MQKKRLFSLQRSQNAITALYGFLAFFVICGLFMFNAQAVLATGDLAAQTFTGTGLGTTSLAEILTQIVRIILAIIGVIAVLLLIYAGFVWMTAAGDAEKVIKAKQIILNAVIGLIIIFSSFAIATFILGVLRGTTGGGGGGIIDRVPGGPGDWSRSAIGAGPIQSVYPAPNQSNISINSRIAVTFKNDVVASTICAGATGNICTGGVMTNVTICELATDSPDCRTEGGFTEADFAGTTVQSSDGRTFVFATNKNLGNEDNVVRSFKVTLKEEIKRLSDNKSVFADMRVKYYDWAFKTNGKLDLNPPEISQFEIYPAPDGMALEAGGDTFTEMTSASAGTSTLTISSIQAERPYRIQGVEYSGRPLTKIKLSLEPSTADFPELNFYSDDTFAVLSTTSKAHKFTVIVSGGTKQIKFDDTRISADTGVTLSACGDNTGNKCLAVINSKRINTNAGFYFETTGTLVDGNRYILNIDAPQSGSSVTLNNGTSAVNYVFYDKPTQDEISKTTLVAGKNVTTKYFTVTASTTPSGNAKNLADRLNSKSGALVTASISGAQINILAKSAGSTNLSLTGTTGITVAGTLFGVSRISNWNVNGVKDAYNNSTFRITFTKAVNPLDIDNFIKIRIGGATNNGVGTNGAFVSVKTVASTTVINQYRTIELTGMNQCGTNACGKPMFCWLPPTDGAVTVPVEIKVIASTLKSCGGTSETWCTAFGGVCDTNTSKRCKLTATGLFYPQAIAIPDGISDLSGNSFNGNFNKATTSKNILTGNAEGQSGIGEGKSSFANPYDLNSTLVGAKPTYAPSNSTGDDFYWKFMLSNQIDLTSPVIGSLEPTGNSQVSVFSDPIKIYFSTGTLIRASTIKPGWGYGTSTADINWFTRFLVLKTLTTNANPVGYWTAISDIDIDGDGLADYSKVGINHNPFDQSVSYGPLAGSGIESITQNCFLPGAGPKNATGVCITYPDGTTNGNCVTDTGDAQIKATNPSSYSTLRCNQIDGAEVCPIANECRDFQGVKEGSWVVTNDFDTVTGGKTGCCLGSCDN